MSESSRSGLIQCSDCKKGTVFVSTLITYGSFSALIGAYAMVKEKMSVQMGFDEGFLGLLDGFSFLGRFLGLLFMMSLSSKYPKRDYFLNCILTTIMMLSVPFSVLIPSWSTTILIIAFLVSGFSRAYVVVPYLAVSQYFDAKQKDKNLINFWSTSSGIGDAVGVISIPIIITLLHCSWETSFLFCVGGFLLAALFMFATTDEIDMSGRQEEEERIALENEEIERQGNSCSENFQHLRSLWEIWVFFRKKGNFLWLIDYALISSVYYVGLLWFPYYFEHSGENNLAWLTAVVFPFFDPIGTIIAGAFLKQQIISEQRLIKLALVMSLFIYGSMAVFNGADMESWLAVLLLAVGGILQGASWPFITSTQFQRIARTNRQKFLMNATARAMYMCFTFGLLIIVGQLMKKNINYLFYTLLVIMACQNLIHFYRKSLGESNSSQN